MPEFSTEVALASYLIINKLNLTSFIRASSSLSIFSYNIVEPFTVPKEILESEKSMIKLESETLVSLSE